MGEIEETENKARAALTGRSQPGPDQPDSAQSDVDRSGRDVDRLRFVAINAFSTFLALATAALAFVPLWGAEAIRLLLPEWEMFAVFLVFWVLTLAAPVSMHYRGNTRTMELDAVPLSIGLAFLSPNLMVLGCVIGATIVFAAVHRQAPFKVFFNVASIGAAVATAAVVFRELLGDHSPVSLQGWAALLSGLIAKELIAVVNVKVVTRLAGQAPEGRTASQFMTHAMFFAAGVCLSIVMLDALWFSLRAMIPLILVAALIILAYRGYARLTLRFASLQRLYDFSRNLGTVNLEPSSMSIEVLRQVCTVMRARRAQLILAEPSGIPRRITLDENGPSDLEPIQLAESSFVTRCIESATASLHAGPAPRQQAEIDDPIAGSYTSAIVAPIIDQNNAIGAIVAVDRDEVHDEFDQDDLLLFDALVAHASANLERARLVEELRFEVDSKWHQATHDMLTGLPNRTLFLTRATSALNDSPGVAIALLDLDRFKDVNDTLGHAIGDRLLLEVSERLSRAIPRDATVARLGGDEFAFVLPGITDVRTALERVHELHEELSHPVEIDGLTLAVTASAGIAVAPKHGDDVALLLQRADIAMYVAKEHRSVAEVYSVEHDQSMRRALMLGGLLTQALETRSQLSVVYHAVADVRTRRVVQVEALTRWTHPVQGPIPPDEFIAIAEQMGTVGQITDFVLSEACTHLADWRRAGLDIGVAVNISGRELADGSLVERVTRLLRANDLAADALTLEVTETEVMQDPLQATRVLDELAGIGVRIAIDDYGTGHSSLAYIHQLPVQKLKIDRSFVTNLPNEQSNRIIVQSSIAMAHSLGLSVVAEGAEDELTCALLADAGCDMIQGFYLSKPLPADDLKGWLLRGASLEFTPIDHSEGAAPLVASSHRSGLH
jgi:diguanylate cyclase (GGDEF)-like protein